MTTLLPSRRFRTIVAACVLGMMPCLLAGCGGGHYQAYTATIGAAAATEKAPEAVEFWFSSLDSVKPYVQVFPTGITTQAPKLDPRQFCPASLVADAYRSATGRRGLVGMPERRFEIMGEVSTSFADQEGGPWGGGSLKEEALDGQAPAPNGRSYVALQGVPWSRAFKTLSTSAARIGADAVIEVFCGKGTSTVWLPLGVPAPSVYSPLGRTLPAYQPSAGGPAYGSRPGEPLFGYAPPIGIPTYGAVMPSSWEVSGLAVRWLGPQEQPQATQ